MKSNDEVIADLNENTGLMVAALAIIPAEKFNVSHENGGWSIAEVAEHLFLIEKAIHGVLKGPAKIVERNPAEKLALVEKAFSDIAAKYQSPPLFIPEKKETRQPEIIEKLGIERKRIIETIAALDLSQTCTAFKHPNFGSFTRFEWVYFDIYHSQRHIKQIENILNG